MELETYPTVPRWVRWSAEVIRRLPRGRYVAMNYLCRNKTLPFIGKYGRRTDPIRFVCDFRDSRSREVCFMGVFEPQESVVCADLLKPGMTFVDVGANWGYFTLLAAKLVGPHGHVLALEPHPQLFSLLEHNCRINDYSWVTPLDVAVAAEQGCMNLIGCPDQSLNKGMSHLSRQECAELPNFQVATDSLEALLDQNRINQVDLLKMDIEGAEALVVPTLASCLARRRLHWVLLELHPQVMQKEWGTTAQDLMRIFLDQGYQGWTIDHSQKSFRRASYRLPTRKTDFLRPLDLRDSLDAWPHFLFAAPGMGYPHK